MQQGRCAVSSKVSDILARCASFELRGPFMALTQIDGVSVTVIRDSTDWASVVKDQPIIDHRNSSLADLFPKPKSVLDQILSTMDKGAASPSPKRSPGMK